MHVEDICGQFLVKGVSNRRAKFKLLGLQSPLLEYPDLPIMKSLRKVLGFLAVIIWKIVSESIFFQRNKFTACKFKDEKEEGSSYVRLSIHFKVRSL